MILMEHLNGIKIEPALYITDARLIQTIDMCDGFIIKVMRVSLLSHYLTIIFFFWDLAAHPHSLFRSIVMMPTKFSCLEAA